jgi:predicted nuclease of predicted toxin-antitoxin system
MKVLVDECVDWRLMRDLPEHTARSVKQLGWEHIDDGELLRLAAAEFDVFLTVDKDLPYQQNIASFAIAVVILRARTTRLPDLRTLLPRLHLTLAAPKIGEVYVLDWRDVATTND